MSIETEITRISTNVSDTLSAVSEMGGEVPEGATSDDMASGVRSIPVGAKIDDTTPSSTTVYSSQKIESVVSALNAANAKQDTEIAKKANNDDLSAVAKSGSYDDLTGKPTIPTVPTALKNPNKLTFKGAVTAEYDGSAAIEVTIPEGGSGGTSGNYMPVNNNYVSDANSVKTTQITKTNNQTANLPSEITGKKWGVIQFVAESETYGNGTQMYWPIDIAYSGRMYIRGHASNGWSAWKRYATTDEIPSSGTGSGSYTLPIASATQLGGVMPAAKTDAMTQAVGVDDAGGLWTMVGGGSDDGWTTLYFAINPGDGVKSWEYPLENNIKGFYFELEVSRGDTTTNDKISFNVDGYSPNKYSSGLAMTTSSMSCFVHYCPDIESGMCFCKNFGGSNGGLTDIRMSSGCNLTSSGRVSSRTGTFKLVLPDTTGAVQGILLAVKY